MLQLAFEDAELTALRPAVDAWTETTKQQLRAAVKRYWADRGDEARGDREAAQISKGVLNAVEYKYPTKDEITLLEKDLGDQPAKYQLAFRVLLRLGLRMREFLTLSRDDVAEALARGKLKVIGKGRRMRVIESRPAAKQFEQMLTAAGWEYVGDLYGGAETSLKTRHSNVDRWLRRYARSCGLNPSTWSPHRLRHGFALRAIAGGYPLHRLQHHLGHRSLETTGRYLHADPSDADALKTYDD